MRVTTKGEYALKAMLDVARNFSGNKAVKLAEISERQKISLHYLEQLFRRLRKSGLVRSVRGPGGGYILTSSPNAISVKAILLGAGENINPTMKFKGNENGTKEHQAALTYFTQVGQLVDTTLRDTTLDQLL